MLNSSLATRKQALAAVQRRKEGPPCDTRSESQLGRGTSAARITNGIKTYISMYTEVSPLNLENQANQRASAISNKYCRRSVSKTRCGHTYPCQGKMKNVGRCERRFGQCV